MKLKSYVAGTGVGSEEAEVVDLKVSLKSGQVIECYDERESWPEMFCELTSKKPRVVFYDFTSGVSVRIVDISAIELVYV